MKNTLLLICLLGGAWVCAQPAFKFSYDASGNRIKRELIDLSDPYEEPGPEEPEPDFMVLENPDNFEPDAIRTEQYDSKGKSLLSEQEVNAQQVTVYPNPTADRVTIAIPAEKLQARGSWSIFSASGKLIKSSKVIEEQVNISLKNEAPGYYILKLINGTETREWTILKD